MAANKISRASLMRIPGYLEYLKSLSHERYEFVSSSQIAQALKLGEIQVRKDLASVSSGGKPRVGYETKKLIEDLENYLGYNKSKKAVIVGAGKLGKALLYHREFMNYGLDIVAAFDNNPNTVENSDKNLIYAITDFPKMCKELNIKIGIITVPAKNAQKVCDLMTENGITAIWNFSSSHLDVAENILVLNESMASSLAILSDHLTNQLNK